MRTVRVKSVNRKTYDNPIPVYDLTVDEYHNFPINKSKIISHNCACYHHGDVSMSGAIVALAAPHANNEPILAGEGTFGSRLVPSAASPRYTDTGLSKSFDKFFPDSEICPVNPDSEHPEPVHYLPIIPWVLVNGVKGIATGFACSILPRSTEDIAALCQDYLAGKALPKHSKPTFPMFNGEVALDKESWVVSGTIIRNSSTSLTITEVPVGYDREKYIAVLDKLEDAGTILSYKDECAKKGFQFSVKLPRTSKNLTNEQIISKLKLVKRYSDNITTINQHGELVIHDTVAGLIKDFCDYRLGRYDDRYTYRIGRDNTKRTELEERVRFCKLVLDGTITLKNKTKVDVMRQLTKLKFLKAHRNKFIELPIHALTKDAAKRLTDEIKKLDNDIKVWRNVDCRAQYIKELKEL